MTHLARMVTALGATWPLWLVVFALAALMCQVYAALREPCSCTWCRGDV